MRYCEMQWGKRGRYRKSSISTARRELENHIFPIFLSVFLPTIVAHCTLQNGYKTYWTAVSVNIVGKFTKKIEKNKTEKINWYENQHKLNGIMILIYKFNYNLCYSYTVKLIDFECGLFSFQKDGFFYKKTNWKKSFTDSILEWLNFV
jgi:hypothetical protein